LGDFDSKLELENAVKKYPQCLFLAARLALFNLASCSFSKVIQLCNQILASVYDAEIVLYRYIAYRFTEKTKLAQKDLAMLASTEPKLAEKIADMAYEIHHIAPALAKAFYDLSFELNGNIPYDLYNQALSHFNKGEYQEALDELYKADVYQYTTKYSAAYGEIVTLDGDIYGLKEEIKARLEKLEHNPSKTFGPNDVVSGLCTGSNAFAPSSFTEFPVPTIPEVFGDEQSADTTPEPPAADAPSAIPDVPDSMFDWAWLLSDEAGIASRTGLAAWHNADGSVTFRDFDPDDFDGEYFPA
jgi:hypothetical protein